MSKYELYKESTPIKDENYEVCGYYWYIVMGDVYSGEAGFGKTPNDARRDALNQIEKLNKKYS